MNKNKVYFNGGEVFYEEYGSGAYIKTSRTNVIIADFPCHLDAEIFMELLRKKQNENYND